MYQDFFHLSELPFSIVPNPKFYYLSERHKEALRHVLNGIEDGGGLALLTGEVGTGKTTTLRQLFDRLPKESQVITILNPCVSVLDLMRTLCQDMGINCSNNYSFKAYYDVISQKLFDNEEQGIQTILLVDEAQHVSAEILEQLRLLTNIETHQRKLLKVILIGQPELQEMLRQPNLRQLAQRITARYHLIPLPDNDVKNYILHRLNCAGRLDPLFTERAIKIIAIESGGIPRLINLICDQALKIAYRQSKSNVCRNVAMKACRDVLDWQGNVPVKKKRNYLWVGVLGAVVLTGLSAYVGYSLLQSDFSPIDKISSFFETKSDENLDVEPDEHSPVVENATAIPLNDLIQESISSKEAVGSLYKQWGFIADEAATNCQDQIRGDLACQKFKLPLANLLAIGRPAVLTLSAPNGQNWFGILMGQGASALELQVGDKRVLLSRIFLENIWSSEAQILWRPPLGDPSVIKMGQKDERVLWLNTGLNLALNEKGKSSNLFDLKLKGKVQKFQEINGIAADGIPGPMTYMMLDSATLKPGPKLEKDLEVSGEQNSLLAKGDIVLLPEKEQLTAMQTPLPDTPTRSQLQKTWAADGQVKKSKREQEQDPEMEAYQNYSVENGITATTQAEWFANDGDQQSQPQPKAQKIPPGSDPIVIGKNNKSNDVSLLDVDLSALSPQLVKRVQVALIKENASENEAPSASKQQTDIARAQKNIDANVLLIEDAPANLRNRLPTLDFQTHIYASQPSSRWIRVNELDAKEGEYIAKGVLLKEIQPQRVVVEFGKDLISIPALTKW